jgi:hypothetical protein
MRSSHGADCFFGRRGIAKSAIEDAPAM